ncbi:MAG: DegV domain-containing protein [Chloroflexi bacterium]|nr:DegV domain-containing protein [Chloroflexota bacterium]
MKKAIVTDSTSDIPQEVREKYKIFQIPAILVIEGESMLDGVGITRNEFYSRLPSMNIAPTTAAPSAGSFQELYQHIFQEGFTEIISIHAASKLSGIFNAARIAAQEFKGKVKVIDSQQLSLGLGFQAIAAAKSAAQNLPTEQILEHIQNIQNKVKTIAFLDTLNYIHRSGRVSWAKARLGGLLNIKPFLEIKAGDVLELGLSRSRKKGFQRLLSLLHDLGPLEYLAILHTNAIEEAQQLLANYNLELPEDTLTVNVTTVIGTHVGPHGLGFAGVVK